MRSMKTLVSSGVCLVLALAVGSTELLAAGQAKFPTKPIIFVAPASVGGGSDTLARLCQASIEKKIKLSEPIVVLNKGGRGGTQEAPSFVEARKGDAHYLLTTTNMFLTYPMLGGGYNVKNFTPIANLVFDPGALVARPESPYKDLEDVIKAAKEKPDTITVGGGQLGTQDHMSLLTLEKAAGIKMRYVPFGGGGELHRNVLGGQIDLAMGNPSDFMASLEAGKLKALVLTTSKRSDTPALANVPTLKEKGFNVSFVTWRGWVAPAGIKAEQIKFLENLFKVVMEDPDFNENYIKKNGMVPGYMPSAEFGRFMKEQAVVYEAFLRSSGVLK
jgi:putative tricarboxylic transport membrane protein